MMPRTPSIGNGNPSTPRNGVSHTLESSWEPVDRRPELDVSPPSTQPPMAQEPNHGQGRKLIARKQVTNNRRTSDEQGIPSEMSRPEKTRTDRINGIGMWKAWKRSFDTPLRALLDLFDNAVDASCTVFRHSTDPRRIGPSFDSSARPKIQVNIDSVGQRGIEMRNSCERPIPPMHQVLEVYKSDKGNDRDIGENGIGVKHACASLCPLSLLFTKTKDQYGMGILMESLQVEDGIVLPSCQWDKGDNLEQCLNDKALKEPRTWGEALREYGEGNIQLGISMCLRHFQGITSGPAWRNTPNVFSVVLTQLRHAAFGRMESVDSDGFGDEGPEEGSAETSNSLLREFREDLPKLYLHLHHLAVSVNNTIVETLYWEKRLVELTKFEIGVSPTVRWKTDLFVESAGKGPYQHRTLRFFAGFDPYRCIDAIPTDDKAGDHRNTNADFSETSSALRVHMYSRASGRHIKAQHDPRSELGLVAGSSDYKQGLTILIDDYNGTLPLNPTKQDTAFGHSSHGLTHSENIKEWTAAITHFFWTFHFDRFDSSKGFLTSGVRAAMKDLIARFGHQRNGSSSVVPSKKHKPMPLYRGYFIDIPDIQWRVQRRNNVPSKIRVHKAARDAVTRRLPLKHAPLTLDDSEVVLSPSPKPKRSPSRRKSDSQKPKGRAKLPDDMPQERPAKRRRDADSETSSNGRRRRTLPLAEDDLVEPFDAGNVLPDSESDSDQVITRPRKSRKSTRLEEIEAVCGRYKSRFEELSRKYGELQGHYERERSLNRRLQSELDGLRETLENRKDEIDRLNYDRLH